MDEWHQGKGDHSFAFDPRGFLVFVPARQLASCNEYEVGDPYSVAANLQGSFHVQRVEITARLISLVAPSDGHFRLLDIGCGEGHLTSRYHQRYPAAEITALDYSISAISRAVEKYPGIDFVVADAYNPPHCDGYFDVVVCNNLWEHVPDPLRLLSGISRVLKPLGSLVISTPSRYRLYNLLRVVRGRLAERNSHHVTEYTVGQVLEQLEYGGFQVRSVVGQPMNARIDGLRSLAREGVGRILQAYLRLVGSHHQLGSTVFYLAAKGNQAASPHQTSAHSQNQ